MTITTIRCPMTDRAAAEKIKNLLPELNDDQLAAIGCMIRALLNLKRSSRELEAAMPKKTKKARRP